MEGDEGGAEQSGDVEGTSVCVLQCVSVELSRTYELNRLHAVSAYIHICINSDLVHNSHALNI